MCFLPTVQHDGWLHCQLSSSKSELPLEISIKQKYGKSEVEEQDSTLCVRDVCARACEHACAVETFNLKDRDVGVRLCTEDEHSWSCSGEESQVGRVIFVCLLQAGPESAMHHGMLNRRTRMECGSASSTQPQWQAVGGINWLYFISFFSCRFV